MAGTRFPYQWDDDYTPRVGLVPRRAETAEQAAADTRWIEVDPCYVFHPLNAYDADDGTIVIDVVRHPSMFRTVRNGPDEGPSVLERWIIDPVAGKVTTEVVDGRPQEFPGPTSAWPVGRTATATPWARRSTMPPARPTRPRPS